MNVNATYKITLYRASKHVGGLVHTAKYACGFWRTLDGKLIALHRDVKSWGEIDEED